MKLTITTSLERDNLVARVQLKGWLNTDTALEFDQYMQELSAQNHKFVVLDMEELEYVSSAGLRVIFKASKEAKDKGNHLAATNRKPHIEKVFEILQDVPGMSVFANDEELDEYLREQFLD